MIVPKGRGETAALLAIWAAGASAVPLDPASPELRTAASSTARACACSSVRWI